MGKRVTNLIDGVFDGVHWRLVAWGLRAPETGTTADFYLLLFLVTTMLSVHPLLCYCTVSRSPHVVFWLGPEPQRANLLVPCALLAMCVALLVLQHAYASQRFVRAAVLLLFLGAGAAMVACGLHVLQASQTVSDDLVHRCGSGGGALTRRVEVEWERLFQLLQSCTHGATGSGGRTVQECPGFSGLLAAQHAIYAGYLQEVEMDFGCSGFCRFWAAPLFNGHAEAGRRCASALGEEMSTVGHLVGR